MARFSRRSFLGAALAAAGVVVAGCRGGKEVGEGTSPAGETSEGEPRRGGQREQGIPGGFNIDPRLDYIAGPIVGSQCYSYLWTVRMDTDEIVPVCAAAIEQVDDVTYLFKIHQNIRFHDTAEIRGKYAELAGRQVTAEDLKYSIERFRDLDGAPLRDYHLNEMDHVEAVDAYTLKLVNRRPYSWTLGANSISGFTQGAIVPREVIEKEGDLKNTCVGSGPFMMDSFSQTQGIRIVRNPNYFVADEPFVDGQRWRIVNDFVIAEAAFRSKQIDTWSPPNAVAFRFMKDMPEVVTDKLLALYDMQVSVRADVPPWNDVRVRQALHLAIDRDALILSLEGGRSGEDASEYGLWAGCLPCGMVRYALSQDELHRLIRYDPAESRRLLSAAGHDSIDVRLDHVNVGKPPQLAETIAGQLRNVGINATLQPSEIARFAVILIQGDFEMLCVQGLGAYSPEMPLGGFTSPRAGAWGGSRFIQPDPEVDAIFEQTCRTFDPEQRQEMAKDMQRLVLSRFPPIIRLYTPWEYHARYDYVRGVHPEQGAMANAFNYRVWLAA
jgi:peptide/nickel transport system substrate-binding protein